MAKRSWIVDLESFNILASNEDQAIEEAWRHIKELGVKIDQVLRVENGTTRIGSNSH